MNDEEQPFVVDLTNCDREPIHISGSIQPHGVLLALREPELLIEQASQNSDVHLGRRTEDVVGTRLSELLDEESARAVHAVLGHRRLTGVNPLDIRVGGSRFDGILHRHDGIVILELEPRTASADPASWHARLRMALADLQLADTLSSLYQTVVRAVRRLTGFERVMLYRFDEDGHGSVEAEDREQNLDAYLGLHYPASDIPKQARELYLRNWLRIIPDARYTPTPLVPATRPDTGEPLDLSFCVLRSVSPIHLEYLANMGVAASMSISVVVRGRLWGLVSCLNHSSPRFIDYDRRSACEAIGRLVSLQIGALEERERTTLREARQSVREALTEVMLGSSEHEVLEALLTRPDDLLGLVNAQGAAFVGESIRTCGSVPSEPLLLETAHWLDEREAGSPFATSSLSSRFPPAEEAKDVASGVLSIALPGVPRRRLMWFRPEVVQTVFWGGDPRKPVEPDPLTRLHPRRSFDKWKEEVRLRAQPWTTADVEAAEELRQRAVEIDLERQLGRAHRAVRIRDEIVAVVSHDLQNPINVIQLQATLLEQRAAQADGGASPGLVEGTERIRRSVDRMNALITDLLNLAKLEDGHIELARRDQDVRDLIGEAVSILRPLAEAKRIAIHQEHSDPCGARLDRERMFQVFSNIIGNAIKFTPENGTVTIETQRVDGELRVSVADTGPGVPSEAMPHVFERYWQAPRSDRNAGVARSGTGLGLYTAKKLVEAHGGRIWVERAPVGGARFTVAIPCAPTD